MTASVTARVRYPEASLSDNRRIMSLSSLGGSLEMTVPSAGTNLRSTTICHPGIHRLNTMEAGLRSRDPRATCSVPPVRSLRVEPEGAEPQMTPSRATIS